MRKCGEKFLFKFKDLKLSCSTCYAFYTESNLYFSPNFKSSSLEKGIMAENFWQWVSQDFLTFLESKLFIFVEILDILKLDVPKI